MGAVIGKGGSTLRQLQQDHKVKIDTPVRDRALFRILGKEANVAACAEAVNRLAEDSVTKTVQVKVKQRLLGRLLGKGGATINKLKGDHGVRISVPSKRDDGDGNNNNASSDETVQVKVAGGCLSVDDAVASIRALVEEATVTTRDNR